VRKLNLKDPKLGPQGGLDLYHSPAWFWIQKH